MMETLKMIFGFFFFFENLLKHQLLHEVYLVVGSFLKEHKILGKDLWCLYRQCSSYAGVSIWISTFGTE